MKTVSGNLIDLAIAGQFDVIIHGCNCFCVMGAGIAKQIAQKFPEAVAADLGTTYAKNKLGKVSYAKAIRENNTIIIVNAYTQYTWSRTKETVADYEAIRKSMKRVKELFAGKRIGYPKIGAGLAGGDWTKIASIIDEELEGEDHTLVIYDNS